MLYFTNHPQQRSSWEQGKKNGMSGPGKVRFRRDKEKDWTRKVAHILTQARKFSLHPPKPGPSPFHHYHHPSLLTLPEEKPNPERTEERTALPSPPACQPTQAAPFLTQRKCLSAPCNWRATAGHLRPKAPKHVYVLGKRLGVSEAG